jgi:hypothetical protein
MPTQKVYEANCPIVNRLIHVDKSDTDLENHYVSCCWVANNAARICQHPRSKDNRCIPYSGRAQTSPSRTEHSLTYQNELDHDDPPTLQERRMWRNAAEVRQREP